MSTNLDELNQKLESLLLNYNTLHNLPSWVQDLTADLLKRNITIETWNHYVRVLQLNSSDINTLKDFIAYLGEALNTAVNESVTLKEVHITDKLYLGEASGKDLVSLIESLPETYMPQRLSLLNEIHEDVPNERLVLPIHDTTNTNSNSASKITIRNLADRIIMTAGTTVPATAQKGQYIFIEKEI